METNWLPIIWFILWGLLWAVYFVLDGFDLGLGMLLPFLGKGENEKRTIYNAAGPFWDGNEVWLITAGGVTFAAFPKAYAVMFSALYAPLLLLLFALIFRAVSFEFRNKSDHPLWAPTWDLIHFLANLVPALLLGVAFANLFMGIPINAQGVYEGNLFTLLNPYGLAGGVFFICIFALHGALWLSIKSEGEVQTKAVGAAMLLWPVVALLLVAFLVMTFFYTKLFDNFFANPVLFLIPVVALVGLVYSRKMLSAGKLLLAWAGNALFIIGVTFFGIAGMFPGMIISSLNPAWSVTAFNAASSPLTLKIMLVVTLIFIPIVIGYQTWVYIAFSYKVTDKELEDDHAY